MARVAAPSWFGQPEGSQLEYKRAEALRHPESITRAVVAFLNAHGGTVVVGVHDDGQVEGVPDAERERDRLQTVLLDHISPRPLREVDVAITSATTGQNVLEIRVKPSRTGLNAEVERGRLGFWIRSGATTRALTLQEVQKELGAGPSTTELVPVRWDEDLDPQRSITLVLQAQPLEKIAERDLTKAAQAALAPEKRDRIDRRRNGWSVVRADVEAQLQPGKRIEVDDRETGWGRLTVQARRGVIRFETGETFLTWKKPKSIPEPVIYPHAVTEGTATFCALLGQIASEGRFTGEVLCQLGLWRPQGWRLGPDRPDSMRWRIGAMGSWRSAYDSAENPEESHIARWESLAENPDREALPLVQGLYQWFGYGYDPTRVPFWNDDQQRFVFG